MKRAYIKPATDKVGRFVTSVICFSTADVENKTEDGSGGTGLVVSGDGSNSWSGDDWDTSNESHAWSDWGS